MIMDNRELLVDMGLDEAIVFDSPEYDDAIIGVTHDNRVVYSFTGMVRLLEARDDMKECEAVEFIEYNTIGALAGIENGPIVVFDLE